jgi:Nucleoside-diphosphate-sugar pyrophosphorylase involved in lipopolysaccharide biosynthesis/translation initiation factor 2B, gamma/epsilon subunits (eIF-2Bgamma/eIF-2Bepsilon)
MKQLVILAGGKGTRLKERLHDLPKPMIPICGKPVLEYQLDLAERHGFTDALILGGYRANAIRSFFGGFREFGLTVKYRVEGQLLGTSGAVLSAFHYLDDTFIVLYGDLMLDVDLDRFLSFHQGTRADATLFVHLSDHREDSDMVELAHDRRIIAFHNPPHHSLPCDLSNAGLYALNKDVLKPYLERADPPTDFGRGLFPEMLANGYRLMGYESTEYIKDIGTPERYDSVCAEWEHRHDYQSHSA